MRSSIVAVLVSVTALLSSCVSRTAHMAEVNKVRGLTATLDQLEQYLDQFEQENSQLRAENARFQKTATDAAWVADQKKKLERLIKELEQQGGGQMVPGIGPTSDEEGNPGIRIDEGLLFASGKAVVSESGKATLQQILPILTRENKSIRVDGHTDDDPIRRSNWKSNLHLSAARALAVAEVLHDLGVPFDRILVRGYGPIRPATRVSSDKAKNRRVELYLK